MRVFEIRPDFTYQAFYTSDPDGPEASNEGYSLNEGPELPNWKPLPMFEAKPQRRLGNFAHCWDGGLIIDTHASNVLKPILEKCAELLPLQRYKGENYHLLNILKHLDCLDVERTKWRIGRKHGKRIGIDEYQFVPSQLTDSTIFRIPKVDGLFTVVGPRGNDIEFKTVVEREGLTGLNFEQIWSEGGPPIRVKGLLERALG
jgi:hypothetical protein